MHTYMNLPIISGKYSFLRANIRQNCGMRGTCDCVGAPILRSAHRGIGT
jgi:hypothetical protein